MNAEPSSFACQTVKNRTCLAGDLVFFSKEFLELVNYQQNARHRRVGGGAIGSDIIHVAVLLELFPALGHFGIQPLQDAQAKLAFAVNGDNFGVRQTAVSVGLESDTLFQVNEVKPHLVGRVFQGQRRNDDVHEVGFT